MIYCTFALSVFVNFLANQFNPCSRVLNSINDDHDNFLICRTGFLENKSKDERKEATLDENNRVTLSWSNQQFINHCIQDQDAKNLTQSHSHRAHGLLRAIPISVSAKVRLQKVHQ